MFVGLLLSAFCLAAIVVLSPSTVEYGASDPYKVCKVSKIQSDFFYNYAFAA